MTAAITADGLARTFPGTPPTKALQNATFTVEPGEFVAIVGRSGSGKSTLLNVLGLLDQPTRGRLELDGKDVAQLSGRGRDQVRSHRLGFVFQESHMLRDQDALSNVALGLRCQRVPLRERAERARAALQQVGLSDRAHTLAKHLSGGERQRLAIARALATQPAILLADEPTGSLDTANADGVIEILKDAAASGVAVIVITHDPVMAEAADRQIAITDGRTDATTPSGESRAARAKVAPVERSQRVRRSWGPGDELTDALNALTAQGIRTLLLVLAFALGVATLVGASGVSATAAQQVGQRLNELSLDRVTVNLNESSAPLAGAADQRAAHIDAIEQLPGVLSVGQEFSANVGPADLRRHPTDMPFSSPNLQLRISAVDDVFLRQAGIDSTPSWASDWFEPGQTERVVLLGRQLADALQIERAAPGVQIWLWGAAFDVVGIIDDPGRAPLLATAVVMPIDQLPPAQVQAGRYQVQTEPGWPPPVAEAIPRALDPVNPARFSTVSALDLADLREGVQSDLSTLVAGLSVILLVLAAVSASSTMLLSIRSRAPEIALRRALGSSKATIARTFLSEGTLIGLAGGALGAALGLVATLVVAAVNQWTAVLDPAVVPVAMALGAITGLVAAVSPAVAAARRDPAQAIRG